MLSTLLGSRATPAKRGKGKETCFKLSSIGNLFCWTCHMSVIFEGGRNFFQIFLAQANSDDISWKSTKAALTETSPKD